jgi:hypothetical protein
VAHGLVVSGRTDTTGAQRRLRSIEVIAAMALRMKESKGIPQGLTVNQAASRQREP